MRRILLRLVSRIAVRDGQKTIVDEMPKTLVAQWPWGPSANPKTAVHEYLKMRPGFQIDADIPNRLLITVAPDGYLKRLSSSTGVS